MTSQRQFVDDEYTETDDILDVKVIRVIGIV